MALITSRPFIAQALATARLQGVSSYPLIVVPHPLGSLSPELVEERAKEALPQVLEILLQRPGD